MCTLRDVDGQRLDAGPPREADSRLSPGVSALVVAALSALSWSVLISAALVLHTII